MVLLHSEDYGKRLFVQLRMSISVLPPLIEVCEAKQTGRSSPLGIRWDKAAPTPPGEAFYIKEGKNSLVPRPSRVFFNVARWKIRKACMVNYAM